MYNTIFDRLINFDKVGKEDCMVFIHKYQTMIDELEEEQLEDRAWLLNKIGYYYAISQNFDKSLTFLQESLATYEKIFPYQWMSYNEEMPQTYELFSNISMVYYCLEMYDDALLFADRAFWAGVGDDSKKIANYELKDTILLSLGFFHAAEDNQKTAVAWSEEYYGNNHQITKRLRLRQAYAGVKEKNVLNDELIKKFQVVLDTYMTDYDSTSLGWALGCEYLSDTLNKQGHFHEALKKAIEAKVIREQTFGICHIETRMIYRLIADIYARNGDDEHAFMWLKKSMPGKFEFGGGYSIVQEKMSLLYKNSKEWEKAIECLKEAVSNWEVTYTNNCSRALKDVEKIADLCICSGQKDLGMDYYTYILNHCKDYKELSNYFDRVGDLYYEDHNFEKALYCYENSRSNQMWAESTSRNRFSLEHYTEHIDKKIANVQTLIKDKHIINRVKKFFFS